MDYRAEVQRIREERKNAPPEPRPVSEVHPLMYPDVSHRVTKQTATPDHLRLVEQALCWGWSDRAAADHAGLSMRVFRELQKDPAIAEHWGLLRQRPELVARRNVAMSLEEGDMGTTKWYLERRIPDFSPKAQLDVHITQEPDEAAIVGALERLVAMSRQRAGIVDVECIELHPETEQLLQEMDPEAAALLR